MHLIARSRPGCSTARARRCAPSTRSCYAQLRAAGGGPYLARPSGALEANPRWAQHPHLDLLTAAEWNGVAPLDRPLGRTLAVAPGTLAWLSDPDRFAARFPALAARISRA